MPYQTIDAAKKAGFPVSASGISLTIAQVNKLASIYDSIKVAGNVDNPMAVAWTQWKKLYIKKDNKWVSKPKQMKLLGFYDLFQDFKGDKVPTEIQIMPIGEWKHGEYGNIKITEIDLDAAIDNFNNSPGDIPVDYEHQTDSGNEAPAAGWIKKLTKKIGQGLWATVEWTNKAKEYIKNKEYRYISPAMTRKAKHKKTGKDIGMQLLSVALTNTPWFDEMQPITAKDDWSNNDSWILLTEINKDSINQEEEDLIMLEKLKKLFKLSADATEDQVMKKASELFKVEVPDLTALFKELKLGEDADVDKAVGAVKILMTESKAKSDDKDFVSVTKFNGVIGELKEMKEKWNKREADLAIDEAITAGKITTAQKGWAQEYALTNPDGFAKFVRNTPEQMNIKRISEKEEIDQKAYKKLSDLALERMKEHRKAENNVSYSDCIKEVARENPELAEQSFNETREGEKVRKY